MASKRTYRDRCGIARALDVVGERWALLVVRELLLGPKRFSDLRAGLPKVSPDVLAQRLRELEAAGILRPRTLPPPAASRVYELTERGKGLERVVLELGRWGSAEPFPDGEAEFGPDSFMLALKTLFDPATAAGFEGRFALHVRDQDFAVGVADGDLEIVRGMEPAAIATFAGEPAALAGAFWHGVPPAQAGVSIAGARREAARFMRLFRPR